MNRLWMFQLDGDKLNDTLLTMDQTIMRCRSVAQRKSHLNTMASDPYRYRAAIGERSMTEVLLLIEGLSSHVSLSYSALALIPTESLLLQ